MEKILLEKIDLEMSKYDKFERLHVDLEKAYVAFRLQLSAAITTYNTVRKDNIDVKGSSTELSSVDAKSIEEGNDKSIQLH